MNRLAVFDLDILLASASPRRKYLLEQAGFSATVFPSQIDESYPDNLPIEDIPIFLAEQKAAAVAAHAERHQVTLAADTIVVFNNKVIGKPANATEATAMLQTLSDNKHLVYTGVCLLAKGWKECFVSKSEVEFGFISKEEIHYYIDTYEPFDKAGSYGIQEWLGWCKITRISGSYSNIMGLPIELVYEKLAAFTAQKN